jgi:hypothetical protein
MIGIAATIATATSETTFPQMLASSAKGLSLGPPPATLQPAHAGHETATVIPAAGPQTFSRPRMPLRSNRLQHPCFPSLLNNFLHQRPQKVLLSADHCFSVYTALVNLLRGHGSSCVWGFFTATPRITMTFLFAEDLEHYHTVAPLPGGVGVGASSGGTAGVK